MRRRFTESVVEEAALVWFDSLGWTVKLGPNIAPGELAAERRDYAHVVLTERVSTKRGTQLRIWATRTLREHLVRGYTLNERHLREKGFGEIEQAVGRI